MIPVKALGRAAILDIALFLAPVCGDTIDAYVVHGESGQPVGGTEVAFLVDRGTPEEILRKRTDNGGRISFSGPFLTRDLAFILVPFYRGIPYPSARLRADSQKQIVLEVFDPGGERADLKIDNHRMVLTVSRETIEVAQFVEIENQGRATYTGSGDGKERRVTEFLLPAGLFGLRSLSGDLVPERPTDSTIPNLYHRDVQRLPSPSGSIGQPPARGTVTTFFTRPGFSNCTCPRRPSTCRRHSSTVAKSRFTSARTGGTCSNPKPALPSSTSRCQPTVRKAG